jgi:MFS family permease
MAAFASLLRDNPNYRYTWMGQVVSEVGDHFNNIAVFSLALQMTGSGLVVTGVMISRAIPAILAGPLAGVLLDRMDRKRIMITSDLVRAVVAMMFMLTLSGGKTWLLYVLSAMLMFASPFFTSGRASILPRLASREELHTANSVTQTTQWATTTVGTFLGGMTVMQFGYHWAFFFNAMSFLFSAWSISRLRVAGGFRAQRASLTEATVLRPWHEYIEGLKYMRSIPLILGVGMIHVGWATGGGAAQILFTLFGDTVFHRGAAGIGTIWGCAGLGLLAGGVIGHWLGKWVTFSQYKRTIAICYVLHGATYVIFSQMERYWAALLFIGLSRAAVAVSSVLNFTQLLRNVSDEYRGRVFATIETMTWSVMMLSMMGAGIASQSVGPRTIGAWSGVLSSFTAAYWAWADWTGRLPEPRHEGVEPEEVEVHGDPTV